MKLLWMTCSRPYTYIPPQVRQHNRAERIGTAITPIVNCATHHLTCLRTMRIPDIMVATLASPIIPWIHHFLIEKLSDVSETACYSPSGQSMQISIICIALQRSAVMADDFDAIPPTAASCHITTITDITMMLSARQIREQLNEDNRNIIHVRSAL